MNLNFSFVDEKYLTKEEKKDLETNGNRMFELKADDGTQLYKGEIKIGRTESLTPMDYRGIAQMYCALAKVEAGKDIETISAVISYGAERHYDIYDVNSNTIERKTYEDENEYEVNSIHITENQGTDKVEYDYDSKYHLTEINEVVNGKTVNLFAGTGYISDVTGKKVTTSMEITLRDSEGREVGKTTIRDTGFVSVNDKSYQLKKSDVKELLATEIESQDDVYDLMAKVADTDKVELTDLSPVESFLRSFIDIDDPVDDCE